MHFGYYIMFLLFMYWSVWFGCSFCLLNCFLAGAAMKSPLTSKCESRTSNAPMVSFLWGKILHHFLHLEVKINGRNLFLSILLTFFFTFKWFWASTKIWTFKIDFVILYSVGLKKLFQYFITLSKNLWSHILSNSPFTRNRLDAKSAKMDVFLTCE